jgi:hypothetical protein
MCDECFGTGPFPENEQTQRALELVFKVYATENGGAGGYGHIVFDDTNTDDGYITWCIEEAQRNDMGIPEADVTIQVEALRLFLTLTEDERLSVLRAHWTATVGSHA